MSRSFAIWVNDGSEFPSRQGTTLAAVGDAALNSGKGRGERLSGLQSLHGPHHDEQGEIRDCAAEMFVIK